MVTIKKNHVIMLICLLIAAFLCLGHAFGGGALVLIGIGLFLILTIVTSMSGKGAYVLCFFIPWAPIMKFEPGTLSLYTVGLIGACIFIWFRHRSPTRWYLIPTALLMALMLMVRLFYGFGIDNSFILFCIMLTLFPVICMDAGGKSDFRRLTLFFSIGIIGAALSAYLLARYPAIARFIDVSSLREVTRYSGYYGDPNYYSAHITAAFAGVSILLVKDRARRLQYVFLALLLLYCGLLSASKSFVIVLIFMASLWIIYAMNSRMKMSRKVLLITASFIAAGAVLTSGLYAGLIDMVRSRFEGIEDISDLTTGRTDLWLDYVKYIFSHPPTLFFGKGLSKVLVSDTAAHNTVIQMVYQLGLTGCVIFAYWLRSTIKIALGGVRLSRKNCLLFIILAIGVLMPWMALDLMFFDEFFLMIFYLCTAVHWLEEQS